MKRHAESAKSEYAARMRWHENSPSPFPSLSPLFLPGLVDPSMVADEFPWGGGCMVLYLYRWPPSMRGASTAARCEGAGIAKLPSSHPYRSLATAQRRDGDRGRGWGGRGIGAGGGGGDSLCRLRFYVLCVTVEAAGRAVCRKVPGSLTTSAALGCSDRSRRVARS